ncbi:hypothetical protein [Kitasatospora viridis]|uniref:Type VII secretion system (Wss) protein ESAT-6 n=1 Tax=Kitasatospora viridis TaxID=281105 RepID=A0A561UMP9_9ACTN|nr:hypothetical protein [Kitasatospora viridis]TWG00604.1 hypothetical protein FHX73_114484 [Kitasatospora viridis]
MSASTGAAPAADAWSGLGFDPVPGDPTAVETLSKTLALAAQHLQGVHDTITKLGQPGGTWTGDAQKAFSDQLTKLPDALKHAADSVDTARQELDKWWQEITTNQPKATAFEQQAETLQASLKTAKTEHDEAAANGDLKLLGQTFADATQQQAAQDKYNAAKSALDDAATKVSNTQADLWRVQGQASQLYSDYLGYANGRADAIRKAADDQAPHKPGIWDWILDHGADFLTVAASVAGIVALFVPGVALLAIALSAAALIAHVATYASQQGWKAFFPPSSKNMGNWLTVGGDALGVIPGVSEIKEGVTAARAAKGLGASVKAGYETTQAGLKGADALNPVTDAARKATVDWLEKKGVTVSTSVADNSAKGVQGAVMAGLTEPTAASLFDTSDNNLVNGTTAGGNAVNSLGFVHGEGSGKAGTVFGTLGLVAGAFGFGWSLNGS